MKRAKSAQTDDWIVWLAAGCGLGSLPRVPGTWGSLGAFPLWLLCARLPGGWYLGALAVLSLAAVYLADQAEKSLQTPDSPVIVIDEIAGLFLALAGSSPGLFTAVAAFIVFRVFDIWKPFPVNWLERHLPGGIGIVADDLAAGVLTWVVLWLIG